jgi:DNA-directed RNA polymerase subunit RPC12/RpoP
MLKVNSFIIEWRDAKMEGDTRLMVCDFCRKSVPISDIKYFPKGVGGMTALCGECRTKKNIKDAATSQSGSKEGQGVDNRAVYFCERCRYKFKFGHDGHTNLKCPYCSKEDQLVLIKAAGSPAKPKKR